MLTITEVMRQFPCQRDF